MQHRLSLRTRTNCSRSPSDLDGEARVRIGRRRMAPGAAAGTLTTSLVANNAPSPAKQILSTDPTLRSRIARATVRTDGSASGHSPVSSIGSGPSGGMLS